MGEIYKHIFRVTSARIIAYEYLIKAACAGAILFGRYKNKIANSQLVLNYIGGLFLIARGCGFSKTGVTDFNQLNQDYKQRKFVHLI